MITFDAVITARASTPRLRAFHRFHVHLHLARQLSLAGGPSWESYGLGVGTWRLENDSQMDSSWKLDVGNLESWVMSHDCMEVGQVLAPVASTWAMATDLCSQTFLKHSPAFLRVPTRSFRQTYSGLHPRVY